MTISSNSAKTQVVFGFPRSRRLAIEPAGFDVGVQPSTMANGSFSKSLNLKKDIKLVTSLTYKITILSFGEVFDLMPLKIS